MALGSSSNKKALGRYVLASELHKSLVGPCWIARITEGDDADGVAFVRRITIGAEVDDASLSAVADAAEFAATLDHESLLGVLGSARDDQELGLASTYQETEPLRGLLRAAGIGRKPVPAAIAFRIATDLLEGLKYLHGKTFAGQSVLGAPSPDNVLLSPEGKTLLAEPVASAAAATAPAWKTKPKRACYDAPELLEEGGAGDVRSDLFTMGVLLWEMLRNRPLFGGSTYEAVAERVKSAAIRRADSLKPAGGEAIPSTVADVVEKALQRDPAERYQSAGEMLEAISGETVATHEEVAAYVVDLATELFSKQRGKVKLARSAKAPPSAAPRASKPPAKSEPPTSKGPPKSNKPTMRGLAPPTAPGAGAEGGKQSAPDAGPPDAGPPDAGPPDAGPPDAGPPDAGPPDAGPPDAGPDAGPPDKPEPPAAGDDDQSDESDATASPDAAAEPADAAAEPAEKPAEKPSEPADEAAEEPAAEPAEQADEPAEPAADEAAAAQPKEAAGASAGEAPADKPAPPAKESGANLAAASGAVAGGYDMLSIADDPSVDEELPDVAKKALAAASKAQDDEPSNTPMLLGVGAVVVIAVVIGAFAMSGDKPTAPSQPTASAAATTKAPTASQTAAATTAAPTAAASATETASASTSADEDADAGAEDAAAAASAEPTASASAPPKTVKTPTKPPRPKTWPKPKQPKFTPGGI